LAKEKGKTCESMLRKAIGSKGKPKTASYRRDFGYQVIKSFSRHGKPDESLGRKTKGSKSEMIRQPVIERKVYTFLSQKC
jgi:hypothetical protein